ncbi:MAG: hypothetical protein AMXMBFR84_16440 [Candidatus Hydrogenedentota bacterium]
MDDAFVDAKQVCFGIQCAGGLVRRHWRAFLILNFFYFGLVAAGMVVSHRMPEIRELLLNEVAKAVESGFLSGVADAYQSGHFLKAAALTFAINLVIGSILQANVPSLILPFSGLALLFWRAFLWGLLFTPIDHPLGLGVYPHYGTLLLEGEAYVLAGLTVWLQGAGLIKPAWVGATTRIGGYGRGLRHAATVYLLIALLLAVAALYEAYEGIYLVPGLLPK